MRHGTSKSLVAGGKF